MVFLHKHQLPRYIILMFVLCAALSFYADANPFLSESISSDAMKGRTVPPLKGGRLSVLLIGSHDTIGDAASVLPGIIDSSCLTVYTHSRTNLSPGDASMPELSDDAVAGKILEELARPYHVIILDFDIAALPATVTDALKKKVSDGAGLVYFGERKALDIFKTKSAGNTDQLKAMSYPGYQVEWAGKSAEGIVLAVTTPLKPKSERARLDYYTALANTLLFASKTHTGMYIRNIMLPRHIEFEGMHLLNFRVDIINDSKPAPVTVRCRYRNEQNRVVKETADEFTINSDKTFVMVNFPLLPIGSYVMDIVFEGADGVVAMSGTTLSVSAIQKVSDIELWSPFMREGSAIPGLIKFSAEIEEGWEVIAELVDGYGRILDEEELTLIVKRRTALFSFLLKEAPGHVITVRISFYKNLELVQVFEKPVYVRKDYNSERMTLVAADSGNQGPVETAKRNALTAAGANALGVDITGVGIGEVFDWCYDVASGGATIIPLLNNPFYSNKPKDSDIASFLAVVDTLRHTGPPAYILQPPAANGDAALYSAFLKDRYTDIGALNGTWGVAAASFDDAAARALQKAAGFDKNAIRLDTDLYSAGRLYSTFRDAAALIAQSDTLSGLTIYGFPVIMARNPVFNAYRWKSMVSSIAASASVADALPLETFLSFYTGKGFFSLIADENTLSNRGVYGAATLPWLSLFRGMNGVWLPEGSAWYRSALTPLYVPSPSAAVLTQELRGMCGGIDMLFGRSERLINSRCAILYNPLSTAEQAYDSGGMKKQGGDSFRSIWQMCRDSGYTPAIVAEEQVGIEWPKDGLSVLFLPRQTAVTDALVEKVRLFVERGGTVVADIGVGMYDERLRKRPAGAFDELFGITSDSSGTAAYVSGALTIASSGPIRSACALATAMSNSSVRQSDNTAVKVLGSNGDVPALIMNQTGQGKTVFLNIDVSGYTDVRFTAEGEKYRTMIDDILGNIALLKDKPLSAGVFDAAGKRLVAVETYLFRDGESIYVGVLTPNGAVAEGSKATFRLDGFNANYGVYDVRQGAYSGVSSGTQITLSPGRADVFAVLPYRVLRLNMSISDPVVKTGDKLSYSVFATTANDTDSLGRHVFRIDVIGPDGETRPFLSKTVNAENGRYDGVVSFALNEEHGRWMLRITDVATSKSTEKTFMVMPSERNLIRR